MVDAYNIEEVERAAVPSDIVKRISRLKFVGFRKLGRNKSHSVVIITRWNCRDVGVPVYGNL